MFCCQEWELIKTHLRRFRLNSRPDKCLDVCSGYCSFRLRGEIPLIDREDFDRRREKFLNEFPNSALIGPRAWTELPEYLLDAFLPSRICDFCCEFDRMRIFCDRICREFQCQVQHQESIKWQFKEDETLTGLPRFGSSTPDGFYPLKRDSRGLIFYFYQTANRQGNEVDLQNLEKTFKEGMKCEFHSFRNKQMWQMEDILEQIRLTCS